MVNKTDSYVEETKDLVCTPIAMERRCFAACTPGIAEHDTHYPEGQAIAQVNYIHNLKPQNEQFQFEGQMIVNLISSPPPAPLCVHLAQSSKRLVALLPHIRLFNSSNYT